MESTLDQIRSLAHEADDVGKRNILDQLRQLQTELEKPMDLFMKLYNSHIQIAVVYVAVQLGLFKHLARDPASTVTVSQLAGESGASPELLRALLRYLASVGFISNPSPDHYQATKLTHFLATPVAEAGLLHAFETCGPATSAIPSFLAESSYADITSNTNTPFQKGHRTDLGAFQWLTQHPKNFGALQTVMTALQSADWLDALDFLDQAASDFAQESEKAFFVDVGGGHGHQCKQLLQKHPQLHGSIVLQDLPQAVDKLPPIEGVKAMAQNFFEDQSVQGAKYYYLRRIMHDWPDADCQTILSKLSEALSADSRILLDEVVLPDENTPWQAAMQDISMKILFAGRERTRSEWSGLIERSGLNLIDIRTYDMSSCASVIVLEKK
ncbi:O-methyltransferase-domain-containing protein [Exophiala viscosa]|uniref:O-methyltransferase-domain-containing protein n=1 Tax=Exophiala viscosa TaxID=2486360 RepID=A0AAN6DXK1_9EURO|nr:O-methyltransferase-domain-containing protein [Exophiala viscosa]KAI1625768.1 O-methyltransferase-domain-containing protein [Exophiala viscosa]